MTALVADNQGRRCAKDTLAVGCNRSQNMSAAVGVILDFEARRTLVLNALKNVGRQRFAKCLCVCPRDLCLVTRFGGDKDFSQRLLFDNAKQFCKCNGGDKRALTVTATDGENANINIVGKCALDEVLLKRRKLERLTCQWASRYMQCLNEFDGICCG